MNWEFAKGSRVSYILPYSEYVMETVLIPVRPPWASAEAPLVPAQGRKNLWQ